MVSAHDIPSLIGYHPEEAEQIANAAGVTVIWVDAEPPRWLPAHHEPRVGRQRVREDGSLELLRILIPSLKDEG